MVYLKGLMTLSENSSINLLAELMLSSKQTIAFTGAGISVASGIPSFRGEDGLWSRYDPNTLELSNYYRNPQSCWKVIKEIFYDKLVGVKANPGHLALTELQQMGLLTNIFTQNIDNLHQESGSQNVYEFHGNTKYFVCKTCKTKHILEDINLDDEYPKCPQCGRLVKPDFIFFSEELPQDVITQALHDAENADLMLIIGCSGEVYPANQIPLYLKRSGGVCVEINPHKSLYTDSVCKFRISGKSQDSLQELVSAIKQIRKEI